MVSRGYKILADKLKQINSGPVPKISDEAYAKHAEELKRQHINYVKSNPNSIYKEETELDESEYTLKDARMRGRLAANSGDGPHTSPYHPNSREHQEFIKGHEEESSNLKEGVPTVKAAMRRSKEAQDRIEKKKEAMRKKGFSDDQVKKQFELSEGNEEYDHAQDLKDNAYVAYRYGKIAKHHQLMSLHHEALGSWHESKGRKSSADKEFEKSKTHWNLGLKAEDNLKEELNDARYEMDESSFTGSHQGKTTLKHIDNPGVELRMAAHDIKPGIKGFRDRIALLKAAEAEGKLKESDNWQENKPGVIKAHAHASSAGATSGKSDNTVYDPITKKQVARKGIKQQAGGTVTRNGKPIDKEKESKTQKSDQNIEWEKNSAKRNPKWESKSQTDNFYSQHELNSIRHQQDVENSIKKRKGKLKESNMKTTRTYHINENMQLEEGLGGPLDDVMGGNWSDKANTLVGNTKKPQDKAPVEKERKKLPRYDSNYSWPKKSGISEGNPGWEADHETSNLIGEESNDYFRNRKNHEDVIAGVKTATKRKPSGNDYFRNRKNHEDKINGVSPKSKYTNTVKEGWESELEECLSEGAMKDVYGDIQDGLGSHIVRYKAKLMDADSLGGKCSDHAELLAKKYNTDPKWMHKQVNDYVSGELDEDITRSGILAQRTQAYRDDQEKKAQQTCPSCKEVGTFKKHYGVRKCTNCGAGGVGDGPREDDHLSEAIDNGPNGRVNTDKINYSKRGNLGLSKLDKAEIHNKAIENKDSISSRKAIIRAEKSAERKRYDRAYERSQNPPQEVHQHHIDAAIGDSYPDGDPYDHLAKKFPHLHRQDGKTGSKLMDQMHKASGGDYHKYVKGQWQNHIDDSGSKEENPW